LNVSLARGQAEQCCCVHRRRITRFLLPGRTIPFLTLGASMDKKKWLCSATAQQAAKKARRIRWSSVVLSGGRARYEARPKSKNPDGVSVAMLPQISPHAVWVESPGLYSSPEHCRDASPPRPTCHLTRAFFRRSAQHDRLVKHTNLVGALRSRL
jgi:hypothetical protein